MQLFFGLPYTGKYYYWNSHQYETLTPGGTVGYAVSIYNDDNEEIYTDTYNYYTVPDHIDHCEIDEVASSSDAKCSDGRKQVTNACVYSFCKQTRTRKLPSSKPLS